MKNKLGNFKHSDNIEGIVNLTEERIKRLTMQDLKEILIVITEYEAGIMIKAIRDKKWQLAANIIELATYKVMQSKCNTE